MFVITVPIACVIGVVKYDRVSCGKRSIPKLFRIDRADADVAESAARGIALQRGLQAAGKGGSGTGSKKKPETTGQAKRSSKAAGGAGAAAGSIDVGTVGDGGGGMMMVVARAFWWLPNVYLLLWQMVPASLLPSDLRGDRSFCSRTREFQFASRSCSVQNI